VRQIRMLRAMRRALETGLRPLPNGHAGGNPGHSQGAAYELPRQFPTLPGSPNLAKSRRKDGERAGRDVPVLDRGHHVLDRPDLGWSESMGRRVRTGRLIIKSARVLQPPPGMEPTRRQAQEPQECPQWHKHTGAIHSSQDPDFVASVGEAFVRQREFRGSKQGENEAK
jgi:hypothetical protein